MAIVRRDTFTIYKQWISKFLLFVFGLPPGFLPPELIPFIARHFVSPNVYKDLKLLRNTGIT